MNHLLLRTFSYLWAGPYTMAGLIIGVAFGGRPRLVEGVIEIEGKGVKWLLLHLPVKAAAMTMGHTVLGQNPIHLDRTRDHERVHVRQFERWGFAMGPAYILASIWCYLRGKNYYRDNPFEIEAYAVDEAKAAKIRNNN